MVLIGATRLRVGGSHSVLNHFVLLMCYSQYLKCVSPPNMPSSLQQKGRTAVVQRSNSPMQWTSQASAGWRGVVWLWGGLVIISLLGTTVKEREFFNVVLYRKAVSCIIRYHHVVMYRKVTQGIVLYHQVSRCVVICGGLSVGLTVSNSTPHTNRASQSLPRLTQMNFVI